MINDQRLHSNEKEDILRWLPKYSHGVVVEHMGRFYKLTMARAIDKEELVRKKRKAQDLVLVQWVVRRRRNFLLM
jgi:hypothetical protein